MNVTFWLDPEFFEGTSYETIQHLIIQTADELKVATEDVIGATYSSQIALMDFDPEDKPENMHIHPKFTVYLISSVEGVEMMDKVGWVDDRPEGW